MSESSYKDGEVVWVKWGNVWWPGEVWSDSRVPEDIITSLRKPVMAFVKFFQEESFEFVRVPNNICPYNSEKKMEFIKKGMDKYRSNSKIMVNFPADVVKAEQLTNGNVNILSALETPTKTAKGASSTNLTDSAKKSTSLSGATSAPSTPVVSKKASGSYNSSVKVQNTSSPVQKSNDKKLTCTMCNFATDRMNLLMMHIKNHSITILSRVNSSSSSSLEIRRPIVPKVFSRNKELDDGIAEDVRKIKESMKETTPSTSAKKTRAPAANTTAKSTPKVKQSRQRKDRKLDTKDNKDVDDDKASLVKESLVDETNKPKSTELKNELLADWLDEEDVKVDDNKKVEENELNTTPTPTAVTESKEVEKTTEITVKSAEKTTNEVSRSIRNIPKKQRVSEIYIQPEKVELSSSAKTETESPKIQQQEEIILTKEEISTAVEKIDDTIPSEVPKPEDESSTTVDINTKKSQPKASKRKYAASDSSSEPEKKKMSEDSDEKILMATAELLNETEVPKISNVQSPSTFHTNDIDKRYLPPKERNKRIFRARNSPETVVSLPHIVNSNKSADSTVTNDEKQKVISCEVQEDNGSKNNNNANVGIGGTTLSNEDPIQVSPVINNKNDRQDLTLPHKKKQSSRLLTADKLSPVCESSAKTPTADILVKEQPNVRSKKNSKSTDTQNSIGAKDDDIKPASPQCPLRETVDTTKNSLTCDPNTSRGQKRQRSKDSSAEIDSINELQPESKKINVTDMPRTIIACANEPICITSKGQISLARRDSIKTTTASTVVVTSQVIISEATKQPIVSSQSSSVDMISSSSSPKQQSISSPTSSSGSQPTTLKNALKIPKENMEELKKQGFLTIENNRFVDVQELVGGSGTILTPKGRQKFKEFQNNITSISPSNSSALISATSSFASATSDETVIEKENDSHMDSQRTNSESSPKKAEEEEKVVEEKMEAVPDEAQKSKSLNNTVEDVEMKVVDDEKAEDLSKCLAEKSNEQPQDEEEEAKKVDVEPQNNLNNNNNNNDDSSNNNDSTQKDESEVSSDSQTDITIADEDEKIGKSTKESDNNNKEDVEEAKAQSEVQSVDDETESSDKSQQQVIENGKGDEDEKESDISQDSGSTGLIALQAETFGGPPNCFYLCRQIDEDRFEPVDNQILVLNAQNSLVPYEGIISDLGLASGEAVQETAYSHLSANSNIIINTPSGQKIELNHLTIMALQAQADENGIASFDLGGESLELNITEILEAIEAQQDVSTDDAIIPGTVLLDSSDVPLIIDSEIPLDVHHPSVATQVSETLSKPIMSTTVAPEIATNSTKSTISENATRVLNIEDSLASIGCVTTQRADVPKSLELPITVTNPKIVETVNHRKLAASLGTDIVTESFVVQPSTDNGSDD